MAKRVTCANRWGGCSAHSCCSSASDKWVWLPPSSLSLRPALRASGPPINRSAAMQLTAGLAKQTVAAGKAGRVFRRALLALRLPGPAFGSPYTPVRIHVPIRTTDGPPAGWPRAAAAAGRRPAAAAAAHLRRALAAAAGRPAPAPGRRSLSVRADAGNGSAADGKYDYDLFCIGAGSGGVRASRVAAGTYGASRWVARLRWGAWGGCCWAVASAVALQPLLQLCVAAPVATDPLQRQYETCCAFALLVAKRHLHACAAGAKVGICEMPYNPIASDEVRLACPAPWLLTGSGGEVWAGCQPGSCKGRGFAAL